MAADDDMKVIYVNEKFKKIIKAALGLESFVGRNLTEFHKPETVELIGKLYKEFKARERSLYYYTIGTPDGTMTIVIVPFYDGNQFLGTVEFIFESSLG
ncbi:MAG: PAS domain-containing protein [Desulfobacteraceae bacterium]|nr:PAS domain-containing protein [Desulfobacteraceae bacterium]